MANADVLCKLFFRAMDIQNSLDVSPLYGADRAVIRVFEPAFKLQFGLLSSEREQVVLGISASSTNFASRSVVDVGDS
jgi:hypothetical protein